MRTVKGIAIVISPPKNQNYAADSDSFAKNLGNQPITSKCHSVDLINLALLLYF